MSATLDVHSRSQILKSLVVTACMVLSAWVARGGDWTHYAGNAAREGIAPRAPRSLDQVAWSALPESDEDYVAHASPVVAGGRVFVNARYFENNVHVGNRVIAYDADDGTRLWETPIDPDVFDSWASPAVNPGNAIVLVGTGLRLHALDTVTGAVRWQTDLDHEVVNASPAVSADLHVGGTPANRAFITDFIFGGGAKLYAVNVDPFEAANNPHQPGEIVWSADLPGSGGNSPAYHNHRVVVAATDGTILAFDALAGGTPLWSTAAGRDGFFGGVTIRDGCVYAATYAFVGGQNNSELVKLDVVGGQVIWTAPCERTNSIPIVTDAGHIYLSGGIDGFGSVVKIQAYRDLGLQAQALWDTYQDTGGALIVGGWTHQPMYARGRLYAGGPDTQSFYGPYTDLYLLNVARKPSDPGFIVAHHAGAGGSPTTARGRLYSLGIDGLFAFDSQHPPATGAKAAEHAAEPAPPPVVVPAR